MLSVLRPFPSPLLSRHGIDLDFPDRKSVV